MVAYRSRIQPRQYYPSRQQRCTKSSEKGSNWISTEKRTSQGYQSRTTNRRHKRGNEIGRRYDRCCYIYSRTDSERLGQRYGVRRNRLRMRKSPTRNLALGRKRGGCTYSRYWSIRFSKSSE